jgi:hypothetical protein
MKASDKSNPQLQREELRLSTLSSLPVVQSDPNNLSFQFGEVSDSKLSSERLRTILNQALALLEDDRRSGFSDRF